MKHMGWDYPALMACPTDYVHVIVDESKRSGPANHGGDEGSEAELARLLGK